MTLGGRVVGWIARSGWLAYARGGKAREPTVQCGRRDVGIGQGIHRGEILCRDVAAERTKRRPCSTVGTGCAVAIGINLAVQLIEMVLAVQRRRLVGGKVIRRLAS